MTMAAYRRVVRNINSGKRKVLTRSKQLRATIRSVANVLNFDESLLHLVRVAEEVGDSTRMLIVKFTIL